MLIPPSPSVLPDPAYSLGQCGTDLPVNYEIAKRIEIGPFVIDYEQARTVHFRHARECGSRINSKG